TECIEPTDPVNSMTGLEIAFGECNSLSDRRATRRHGRLMASGGASDGAGSLIVNQDALFMKDVVGPVAHLHVVKVTLNPRVISPNDREDTPWAESVVNKVTSLEQVEPLVFREKVLHVRRRAVHTTNGRRQARRISEHS